jgi:hypothetical protein
MTVGQPEIAGAIKTDVAVTGRQLRRLARGHAKRLRRWPATACRRGLDGAGAQR